MINKQVFMKLLILIGYAGFMLYLLVSGKIAMYVHPKMNIYVTISAAVFILLALVIIKDLFKRGHTHGDRLSSYGIFIIALVIAVFVQPISLNSVLAQNRGVTINKKNVQKSVPQSKSEDKLKETGGETGVVTLDEQVEPNDLFKGQKVENIDLTDSELVVKDENYAQILDVIYSDFKSFINKKIVIRGFVFRENGMEKDNFVIARSAINCCAADASVVGFLCQFSDADKLKNDEWIEVKGNLQEVTYDGEKIPVIVVEEFKKVEKPSNEYIYLY
ncbi:MAG: TIGR03943 family protein [Thermincola sp.]|nr:TIGR03943 family protein [Thermincola sp.]MDT3703984.1 TIGR03943 family protein [Thermincola sp.]